MLKHDSVNKKSSDVLFSAVKLNEKNKTKKQGLIHLKLTNSIK